MSHRISVVIADGHAATRAGIRRVLKESGFEVRALASDAEQAVRAAEEDPADIYVLGVNMPGGGLAAAGEIRVRRRDSTIVMLTEAPNDAELLDALRAGASGYLPKDMDPSRLPFALRDACDGVPAIPRQLMPLLLDEVRRKPNGRGLRLRDRPDVHLSDREWEILEHLHAGRSTAEIAGALAISPITVRRHISSLVRKLDVLDREAAVRLVERARDR